MANGDYLATAIIKERHHYDRFKLFKPISVKTRTAKPAISHSKVARQIEVNDAGVPFNLCYVDEPGKVSFGIKDYAPGVFIPLHHHHTWELVIIDSISEGPGYIFFDEKWWRCDPETVVFIPNEYPCAWSAGRKSFRMLWIYGGSLEETGRVLDLDTRADCAITPEEEYRAPSPDTWSKPDMLKWEMGEYRFWTE